MMKFNVRKILKELKLTKQNIVDWAKREIPWVVYDQDFWNLKTLKKSTITWSGVPFKILLMHYLSKHNFVITGDNRVFSKNEYQEYRKSVKDLIGSKPKC